jgi:hypothetical protein
MTHGSGKSLLSKCGIGAVLFLLLFLLPSSVAFAGGYVVTYGFDDPDNSKPASWIAKYDEYCDLELKNGNIALSLDFSDAKHKAVNITILYTNWGAGCCYFEGGANRVRRDPGSRIVLNVCFGRARRGFEYVESNIWFGMLFLFSDKN